MEISYNEFDYTSEGPVNYYVGKSENWGPIELGGRTWKGYIGVDVKKAFIWTNNYDGGPCVHIWMEDFEIGGIKTSPNDVDVQSILASFEF